MTLTTLLTTSLLLLSTSLFANSSSLLIKSIKDATLFDGRIVDFKTEVQDIVIFNNDIDYLELVSGEIVDSTDITSVSFSKFGTIGVELRMIGINGGG